MVVRVCVGMLLGVLVLASSTQAQTTPPRQQSPWKYNMGGGVALTTGNKDTSTYNASYAITYTPSPRRQFKSDALLIRGRTDGELSNDRFGLNMREEFRVNERVFVFGQNQYRRDRFKRIQFLVAPTGGVGLTTVKTEATTLTFDVGAGGVWEKNPYEDVQTSGALTFTQKLSQAISTTTTLTQSVFGLWKTEDLTDSYYQFGVAVATAINSRVQLKVEALDTYNRKVGEGVEKNDISMVIAVVFKN